MIQKLHIQNYAIIDALTIEFSGGMNVITGETGAGKSILMGALSLILGDRADSAVLLEKDRKCFVEGTFTLADSAQKEVVRFFKENDLDVEDEIIIRREIAVSGKSRAFVNDTPVNLEQLRRGGFFHENKYKGGRKYFTTGFGVRYRSFGLDFAYLIPLVQNNPLAETLRFTLHFTGTTKAVESTETITE